MAEQETLRGDVGEYRIYESIASGGFGSVFYGRDTAANVPVAVKRLHPHLKDQPGFVQRFEQEASTVRGLVHPNIVRMVDQGRDNLGVPFLVMEWVEGQTVGEWVKRRGLYSVGEAAEVICQVLQGLQAAWTRNIVHRDIKPANLMVTPGGRVKVMDFGVAKDVELATLGGASGVIGTPAYMAPEQLRGQPLDCRADLYALGATLYMMLVGRPPFEGPTMTDYFRQHLQDEPPPLEQALPGVHPTMAAVVARALAKWPEERFSTPAEMLAALQPLSGSETIAVNRPVMPAAPPAPTPQPAPAPAAPFETAYSPRSPAGASSASVPPGQSFRTVAAPDGPPGVSPPAGRGLPRWALFAAPLLLAAVAAVVAWRVLQPASPPPIAAPTVAPTPLPTSGIRTSPTSEPGSVSTATPVVVGAPTPPGAPPAVSQSPVAADRPVGAVLLRDSLTDVSAGSLLKVSRQPSLYYVGYTAEGYVVQRLNPTAPPLISVSVPGIYTDTQLEVDVRIQDATPNRFVAITCREQQASDGSTDKGYRFVVSPAAGNVVIERVDGGRSTTLAGPATASAMRAGGAENRVALTCAGSRIAGRINNTDVISVEDAAHREGSLLIGTGAADGGPATVEARFRDLVLYGVP